MITQSAVRQAISHESINLLKSLSILDRDSVILDKDSDFIFNKNSDSRFLCLSESASHSSADVGWPWDRDESSHPTKISSHPIPVLAWHETGSSHPTKILSYPGPGPGLA